MQEYQSYKGQYIGPGCFSSRAEVDKYLEQSAVEYVKRVASLFLIHKNHATANELANAEKILVDYYGYTWEEAEAIEIEVFKESETP